MTEDQPSATRNAPQVFRSRFAEGAPRAMPIGGDRPAGDPSPPRIERVAPAHPTPVPKQTADSKQIPISIATPTPTATLTPTLAQREEPAGPVDERVSSRARLALATGSLAFVLGTVNVTVTNVAFPDIVRAFPGVSGAVTGWIVSGYALAFSSTIIIGGRLADRYGRLVVFRLGVLGLFASSIAAGLAPGIELLLIARVVQGLCGALTVPSSLALVLPQFPAARQASVIGVWASAGMGASGIAPGMAAGILEIASWRWVYLTIAPIAALAFLGSIWFLQETAKPDRSRPLDLLGVAMGTAAVFFVVLATLQGRFWGWGSVGTLSCFIGAAVLLPLFLWRSTGHDEPLFDPRLFRVRSFAVANMAVSLAMIGAFTSWFLWPQYLVGVWDYSLWAVGLAFTPAPIISAVMAVLGGRWADKHGFRGMMALASAVATVGHLWLLFFLDENVRFWFAFFPATVFFGLGMGLLASHLNSAALVDIKPDALATANGVHQSLRYSVGGVGVAIAIAVLGGAHEVHLYNWLWLLLGGLQALCIPLMGLAYPRKRPAAG